MEIKRFFKGFRFDLAYYYSQLNFKTLERVQRKGLHYQTFAVKIHSCDVFISFLIHKSVYIYFVYKELKNHTITSTFELLPRALRMHE